MTHRIHSLLIITGLCILPAACVVEVPVDEDDNRSEHVDGAGAASGGYETTITTITNGVTVTTGGGATLCSDSCADANDGYCDDGGAGAWTDLCAYGTDCGDCGPRGDDGGWPSTTTSSGASTSGAGGASTSSTSASGSTSSTTGPASSSSSGGACAGAGDACMDGDCCQGDPTDLSQPYLICAVESSSDTVGQCCSLVGYACQIDADCCAGYPCTNGSCG